MLGLDHVVHAVPDLDAAAERYGEEYGLDSAAGGRHADWGTENRIVPLGAEYIELISVADPERAGESAFGRSVLDAIERGGSLLTICAATDELGAVVRRLDLRITVGSRERPDGTTVRWRSAALEDERREPWMPFFIQWDVPPELHPGKTRVGHRARPNGIAWVEVSGDEGRLREWLGGAEMPIRFVPGPPGLRVVGIATPDGDLIVS